ncbi:MAG: stalk domain-containing protein [Butyricicoccus sp.]|nr:stalk domain-containing protein [Butyricicoccus sp.]
MEKRINKKLFALLAVGAMLLCPAQAAVQEDFYKELAELAASRDDTYYFGSMVLTVGSDTLVIDEQPQPLHGTVELRNERTMLPVEAVARAAGAVVSSVDNGRTTVITGQYGEEIRCTEGSDFLTVNGQEYALDAPAYQKGEAQYLPVRAVAEALGLTVTWEPSRAAVTITAPYQTARLLVVAEELDTDRLGASAAIFDGEGLWAIQFDTPAAARAAASALAAQGITVEPDRYIPPSEMEGGIQ